MVRLVDLAAALHVSKRSARRFFEGRGVTFEKVEGELVADRKAVDAAAPRFVPSLERAEQGR